MTGVQTCALPILQLSNVDFSYGSVQVLFDVLDIPDRKPALPKPAVAVTRGAITI